MLPRVFRVAVIWSLTAVYGLAQSAPNLLTLNDCIRLAQAAPSAVSLARQQTAIARYGFAQARAGFLPQAHLGNVYAYNSPQIDHPETFSFVALNGIREYTSLFTIGQELDTSGRLRATLARARADQEAALANLGLAQRDLRRAVTAAYYHLLLLRHLVQVERDALAEAQSFEGRAKLLAQNGEAAQADVVKASSQVAVLEQGVKAAELEAQMANHDLASFWTAAVTDPLPLVDVFDQTTPSPDSASETQMNAPFMRRLEFLHLPKSSNQVLPLMEQTQVQNVIGRKLLHRIQTLRFVAKLSPRLPIHKGFTL